MASRVNKKLDREDYANDLAGFHAYAQDIAQMLFEETGSADGIVLAEKTGAPLLVTEIRGPGNNEQMNQALGIIQRKLEEAETDRAANIFEVWGVMLPKDYQGTVPHASLHPDRKEYMRVVARDCTGKGLISTADIIRPADGAPQLGSWDTVPASDGPLLGIVRNQ